MQVFERQRALRKIRYESQFGISSRLTSLTAVLHPHGLIPLTALPRSALTMPGDVRDVASVSTDVNAVCVVLKTGDDVTRGLKSSTSHSYTHAHTHTHTSTLPTELPERT